MKYLVAPKQLVSAPLLEAIPDVQKLRDPVGPDVIGVLLGLIPLKRRPKEKETHYDAAAVTAGDIQIRSGCLRSQISAGGPRRAENGSGLDIACRVARMTNSICDFWPA